MLFNAVRNSLLEPSVWLLSEKKVRDLNLPAELLFSNGRFVLLAGHTRSWCYFGGGVAATLGTFFHSASTAGGSLSICLRNIAIFQICSSCSVGAKLGIAVKRIPCLTFQNETGSGSYSTPSLASCGASI